MSPVVRARAPAPMAPAVPPIPIAGEPPMPDLDAYRRHVLGACRWCGAAVRADAFRDLASRREYTLLRLCQRCQDRVYLAEPRRRPGPKLALHDAAVVAPVTEAGALRELAVLPFVFVAAEARIAWEPRFLVRAGPRAAPLDPYVELTPMRAAWRAHQIRVVEVRGLDHPRLRARLSGAALVVGLDAAALRAVETACALPPGAPLAGLAEGVAWRSAYRHPLQPFARFVRHFGLDPGGPPGAPSVLRLAALIAAAMELPSPAGPAPAPTAFALLLRARRAGATPRSGR